MGASSIFAKGMSKAQNLLLSEDVLGAIKAIKKLGKVKFKKNYCIINGQELMVTTLKKCSY